MDKQYRRALTLLKGSDLVEQDVRFRYLAAKCLVECQEWEECLMMVGGWEEDSLDSIDMQVTRSCSCYPGLSSTADMPKRASATHTHGHAILKKSVNRHVDSILCTH